MARKTNPNVTENGENITEVKSNEPIVKAEKKKSFLSTDGILCRSVTPGALFVDGPKTGMLYTFANYGDETEIEYRDLKALIMTKSVDVFGPRFIVEDPDFLVEVPQLDKFYSERFTTKDLADILKLPIAEMLTAISKLPEGAVKNLKSLAATAVSTGSLDSIKKIRALDELWGTDFNIFSTEE